MVFFALVNQRLRIRQYIDEWSFREEKLLGYRRVSDLVRIRSKKCRIAGKNLKFVIV